MTKKVFYSLGAFLIVAILFVTYLLLQPVEKKAKIFEIKEAHPPHIRLQPNTCPQTSGTVNITLITDSNYIVPTKVSMYSAIKTKCPNTTYNYYIITENVDRNGAEELLRLKELAPETVNIHIIPQKEPNLPFENMQRFLQYKVGMHKIFLPNTLKTLDKVIYMDGDTIVLKDLRTLYEIDVNEVYASVAKDGIFYRFPKEMAEIGLDKRGFYFNSGVMLYNLQKQRADDMVNKLVKYVNTHSDFFGDQDVLNIVFGDKLKLMSYRYDCISTFFEEDDLKFLSTYFGEELPHETFYIYENATIIHYAGDKPWQENYKPLYLKDLWFRFYNEAKDI